MPTTGRVSVIDAVEPRKGASPNAYTSCGARAAAPRVAIGTATAAALAIMIANANLMTTRSRAAMAPPSAPRAPHAHGSLPAVVGAWCARLQPARHRRDLGLRHSGLCLPLPG